MPTLVPATRGYSKSIRGTVNLKDGRQVFVKIAVDEATKRWVDTEIKAYKWLAKQNFKHTARLLSSKQGALAIEDLSHLDFSEKWDIDRLNATLAATDELAALKPGAHDSFKRLDITNGWHALSKDETSRFKLLERLSAEGLKMTIENIERYGVITDGREQGDVLVHADVRGDNAAYDAKNGKVYLIDWSWFSLGSRQLDLAAFLVHVEKGGLNVKAHVPRRLDRKAALYMAGFWFYYAVQPIWDGGDPELRERQYQCALIAYRWSKELL